MAATNKVEKSRLSWLFMYQATRFEISYRQTSVHIEADAKFTLIEKMIAKLKDLLNKFCSC